MQVFDYTHDDCSSLYEAFKDLTKRDATVDFILDHCPPKKVIDLIEYAYLQPETTKADGLNFCLALLMNLLDRYHAQTPKREVV